MGNLYPPLKEYIEGLNYEQIPSDRRATLQPLVDFIQSKIKNESQAVLNFICTHNSRRSQFAQVWAQIASYYYNVPSLKSYSGGTEATEFNQHAVQALKRAGLHISKKGNGVNPIYFIGYSPDEEMISAYSKMYNDPINAQRGFAAIMVCAQAEQNCPYIPKAEARIPITYEDPKIYDDTDLEAEKYDESCREIAAEMFYVFSKV